MNIDEILTLVQAVSDSSLTSFKLEQAAEPFFARVTHVTISFVSRQIST